MSEQDWTTYCNVIYIVSLLPMFAIIGYCWANRCDEPIDYVGFFIMILCIYGTFPVLLLLLVFILPIYPFYLFFKHYNVRLKRSNND